MENDQRAGVNNADLEDANYRSGDLSRRCNSSLVVAWLRDHYRFGKSGSISKNSVYLHYLDACGQRGLETDINQTFFGKLVKKAFPGIQYNRKGPRGRSEHHYKHLKRAKHAHSAGPSAMAGAAIPPAPLPHAPEQGLFPCCHQQQQQHTKRSFPTNLGPSLLALPGELGAIGRTSSRSPSPPSSPPSSLHPNHYYPYHAHLPLRPPHPSASDSHHHHHSQAPPHCPCPIAAHRPERTTITASSSPRSSPIPQRPYPAPYTEWNAAITDQYPHHQQQQPLQHSRMPIGRQREDVRQLQPTAFTPSTGEQRPAVHEASWSEWSFSKMVEPVAQPLSHPYHHHHYTGEWEETAHHHSTARRLL